MEIKLPDIKNWTWPLLVIVAGGVFSVFALIYAGDKELHLGIITFLYGVVANLIDKWYWYKHQSGGGSLIFFVHILLIMFWVFFSGVALGI